MTLDGDLLSIACSKICDLATPAYVKDGEQRFVIVNEAFAAFFRMAAESFIGRLAIEVLDRPEDEPLDDRERRALVFGDEQSAPCFDPFGPECYRVRLERFETEDGQIYLFGMFDEKPIGAGQRARPDGDADPVVAEHLFRSIVEESPSALYLRDSDHRLLLANSVYLSILGRSEDEVIGKTEIESFGADGQAYYLDNQVILEKGELTENEEYYMREDGQVIPVITRSHRLETADGKRYIIGSMTQITQLKQREADIRAAQADAEILHDHLESLMKALPVGVLILDGDLVIEYANDAFYNMWAVDHPFDLTGWSYEQFLDYNHEHGLYRSVEHSLDVSIEQRVRTLRSSVSGAAWELPLPDGRVLAVSSKRLENGKFLVTYSDITTVREREQESSLYRAALEQMPVPVFLRDENRRLVFINTAYERLLGDKRETFLGQTEEDMFPDAADSFREQNIAVLNGAVIEKNEEITMRDGRRLPVITRLDRIEGMDGQHFIVGSITDVSILKARELELIAAQGRAERFSSYLDGILRNMPVGVMILDERLEIEFANAKVAEIWGWPGATELEHHDFREYETLNREYGWTWLNELDFGKDFMQRLEELRISNDTPHQELRSSEGKMVVVTAQRLIGDKMLLTYADITDVRQREQEISDARAQLAQLGAFMQDATRVMLQGLLVIEEGVIRLCNEAFINILDVPAEMATHGRDWQDIFAHCAARGDFGDSETAGTVLKEWEVHAEAMQSFSRVFCVEQKRWVQLEATPSGRGHWMIVCTDVTESKEREKELTTLLARSEAADRAKSEFLANMSHEIRTPMNGVLGMAELLSKSSLDIRQKTFVDIIVKSGNALLTIINDILDFSKIDAGQLKLRKAPFDPVEAIEDIATLLSAAAAEKDIELIVRGDATVRHMLVGDAGRFRQIVTNLVGNAIKFTEKGHVLTELSSELLESGQIMLEIRIEDTGIGIPASKRKAIFEKFSQVDNSSTRRHEGTGLGLAITAGLVELFGGYIDVESEPGRGSVFTVHIPFTIASDRNRLNPVPVTVQDARVLVIDDNAVNRQILTEQLSSWGFDGVAVEDGMSAFAILDEAHDQGIVIDVLVIDYQMPVMNGIEVARMIRSDPRHNHISIIFLTSMDTVGDDTVFRELNVQAHLMKPARAFLLKGAIVDVVRAARLQRGEPMLAPVPPGFAQLPDINAIAAREALNRRDEPSFVAGELAVLVAEDNEVNQIVFTQILQETGLRFLIVGNGQQAVDACERYRPGVIVMDVSMPVMNGHQATKVIRVREQAAADGRHVPIIGVTAHALESDRDLCFAAGMDDYMSKPISPELLQQKIAHWLGFGQQRAVAAGGAG